MRKIENFIRYFIMKSSEADFASAYLAFYILLSFIPLLAFLSNLIIYVVPNFNEFVYSLIIKLPNDVQKIFRPMVESIFNGSSSSLSVIAILSALWLGSRGFLGLLRSLNKIFEVDINSKIPYFDKFLSVIYTIIFMILLASLLLFSVFNEKIIDLIRQLTTNKGIIDKIAGILIGSISNIFPILLAGLILMLFYRFAPSFKKNESPTLISIILGSIVATLGIILVTFFYKYTNDTLQQSPSYYGSLGSILVTLVWLLTVCSMIIYGAIFIKTYEDVIKKKMTIKDLDPNSEFFLK